MRGRLVVCPTPIGNLEDVTLRVLRVLGEADVIACEDTRHTRKLLDRHGMGGAQLVSYHEHNERARAGELAARIESGEVVALVTDAGTPAVSDPGFVLVRECVGRGLDVEVLPGPSAVVTALVASALPADRWRFAGFLPRKAGALRAELERGGGDAGGVRVAGAAAEDARTAGRDRPGARGGGVPGADQAARGGGARTGARGRGAVRGGGTGRDRAGDRARRGGSPPTRARRGRRSRRWSRRAPGGGRRRRSSRG